MMHSESDYWVASKRCLSEHGNRTSYMFVSEEQRFYIHFMGPLSSIKFKVHCSTNHSHHLLIRCHQAYVLVGVLAGFRSEPLLNWHSVMSFPSVLQFLAIFLLMDVLKGLIAHHYGSHQSSHIEGKARNGIWTTFLEMEFTLFHILIVMILLFLFAPNLLVICMPEVSSKVASAAKKEK